MQKLEWSGYPMVKKSEDMSTRFDRMHERNRQTDRQAGRHIQTPHDGIGRACIASRGEKWSREYRHSF